MLLKSQTVLAPYLQPFDNGTRKTWGGAASEAPPPPAKNTVKVDREDRTVTCKVIFNKRVSK